MIPNHASRFGFCVAAAILLGLASLPGSSQEPAKPKYAVKITDEKTVVVNMEDSGAIDPTRRINFSSQGNFFCNVNTIRGETLHLSHFPNFMINGRFMQQALGGRFEVVNARLEKGKGNKVRDGFMTVWLQDTLRITQTMELHPSKPKKPGEKRLMNNVLITYTVENKGKASQNFGLRVYMDTFVINNDGCMFAAPVTHPGKILDGMVLKDKTLPPYLQMLQVPDLKNPGYMSHLTLNVGGKLEKASRLVLTRHGAGFGGWDMPAFASMGDSAIGIYWEPKELKAGAKREMGYAYGEGIAVAPESEGRFQLALGGSFEPGKVFTISAVVADPGLGQTISLDLPAGIERLEGAEVQPVAPLSLDQEYSTVLWKARVRQPGQHKISLRSSTGVTQSKIVSVTAEK